MTDISVFASYSHDDDRATYGRASKIITDIGRTYAATTGLEVGVFQDIKSIPAGLDWRERIRAGLASSTIFLSFVSPSYFRSPACREELTEFFNFLAAEGEDRLILPLVFANPDNLRNRFAEDELWNQIDKLQYISISELRQVDPGSHPWMSKVSIIAERIDEILSAAVESVTSAPSSNEAPDSAEGFLEQLARFEDSMPEVTSDSVQFAELLNRLGEEVGNETVHMHAAETFKARLVVATRLARTLTPLAAEFSEVGERLGRELSGLDGGLRVALAIVESQEDPEDLAAVEEFLSHIHKFATATLESSSSFDGLYAIINTAKGYSRELNVPLERIQKAILAVAGLRGTFRGWLERIDAVTNTLQDKKAALSQST